MDALIQPLPFDPLVLPGLSERMLRSHHANNYGGAVKRLNAIRARLASLTVANAPGFELNGLKREELIACNSMLLHELHFASMGGDRAPMVPAMELALCASFGSVARWRDEFIAMGKALAGGSGWVLLVYLPREGQLVNQWAADHTQALAGGLPVLALDMYEHAYHLDFGADAARWVDAFMANLNWACAYQNYQHAVEGASEMYGASADELQGATIFDVRRAAVFEAAVTVLPGAQWRDPAAVQQWSESLEQDQPIVLYCVYGHEVCRATALRLRSQGRNARFLRGGIDAWQKSGLPLVPKAVAS
ncbi:MAG: superoxide dismutase [Rhodoferax sp.]|nr:superoxide dismutase [Rhodoferax sp.]MBP9929510.1 superoxide dismutase [Rhodoferax sp.]HQZ05879.1 Fe-Mn family superoxide dismutase [Burkholderiaceae bacterium]HRA62388.1 Fe-Mn family superoxide dismutase [Burkholderiaceae bacterium]